MQTLRAQQFNQAAAEAYEAFPQELERLIILLVPFDDDTPVFISPAIAQKLSDATAAVQEVATRVAKTIEEKGWAGLANRDILMGEAHVNLIALKADYASMAIYPGYTKEMANFFMIDHELAHHIVENARPRRGEENLNECAADVCAMLRHIQRFGPDTAFARDHGNLMARNIVVHADADHYTSDALEAAVQLSKEMDISQLSLRETARLAAKIARKNHPKPEMLSRVRKAFQPVHDSCTEQLGGRTDINGMIAQKDAGACELICRETLAVMREHGNDHDIFRAGQRFLAGTPSLREFMLEEANAGAYWKDALEFLDSPKEESRPRFPRPVPRVPKFMGKLF